MKNTLALCIASVCVATIALGQTPAPPTEKPKPSTTQSHDSPPPPKTAPKSSNPEDPHTATTGGADQSTYQAGKKADSSAGCSTPTDARSAGIDTSKGSPQRERANGNRTVCTTSGAEGVGAKDNPKGKKPREAVSPPSSSSPNPR